jgi:hypothetical protein
MSYIYENISLDHKRLAEGPLYFANFAELRQLVQFELGLVQSGFAFRHDLCLKDSEVRGPNYRSHDLRSDRHWLSSLPTASHAGNSTPPRVRYFVGTTVPRRSCTYLDSAQASASGNVTAGCTVNRWLPSTFQPKKFFRTHTYLCKICSLPMPGHIKATRS